MAHEYEHIDRHDVFQAMVGSLIGAMTFSVEGGICEIGDNLNMLNIALIAVFGIAFSYLISYRMGVRRLGKRRIKFVGYFIPLRILIHYGFAVIFSITVLWIFGLTGADGLVFLKRIAVLSLPAVVIGSSVDLIDSQKVTE